MSTATALSKAELSEFLELAERKSQLEREARAIGSKLEGIKERCLGILTEAGKNSLKRFGFQLSVIDGRATVSWKDHFIRVAGQDEATRLQNEAPRSKQVQIVKIDADE